MQENDENIEDFIDSKLDFVRVASISAHLKAISIQMYPVRTVGGRAEEQDDSEDLKKHADEEQMNENRKEEEWDLKERKKLRPEYSKELIMITHYLMILRMLSHMTVKEFWRFKKNALLFMIHWGHLFKRVSKNMSLCWVINSEVDWVKIFRAVHEESGHRDRKETYRRVAD